MMKHAASLAIGLLFGYFIGFGMAKPSAAHAPAPGPVIPAPIVEAHIEPGTGEKEMLEVIDAFQRENDKLRELNRVLREKIDAYEAAVPNLKAA